MLLTAKPAGLTLPLVVVALVLVSAEGVAAKCNAPGNPAPFWIIDDSVAPNGIDGGLGAEGLDEIDPSDIHSLEVTCWNPKTGEIGGGTGLPVIRIVTKSFVESARAPIEGLLRAQQAHFSELSRYARRLVELVRFGVPHDAMLEFSVTSAGWSATTPRDGVFYRCFVFSGDAPREIAAMKEHEIVCQPEAAKASRALREMYEGEGG